MAEKENTSMVGRAGLGGITSMVVHLLARVLGLKVISPLHGCLYWVRHVANKPEAE